MTHWTIRDDDERSISSEECPWLERTRVTRAWEACGHWQNPSEECKHKRCPRKEEK